MNDAAIPPVLDAPKSKWRWGIHLTLLIGYVLGIGIAGSQRRGEAGGGSAMPGSVRELVFMCSFQLLLFSGVFAAAWVFSRARIDELFLRWRGGIRPILWGMLHSVLLRVGVMIVVALIVVPVMAIKGEKSVEGLRPKTEAVVDAVALKDPVYFALTLTLVSFVMAGFTEELWRAAVLAGLIGIAPNLFSSRKGQFAAVLIVAAIFGLGHLPQGWGGVFLTGLLGIGLGSIIIWHRSVWEAIIAHGFFDATTFVMLYVITRFFPDLLKSFGISG